MGSVGEGYAFVMAGGAGSRLQPLTTHHCKPALPFGAHHRVVDFVLSNLLNAGLRSIDLLVQYRPETLVRHVERRWPVGGGRAPVRIAAPKRGRPYLGTADAVRQNLAAAQAVGASWVAVFGADHVYRMDVKAMVDFHLASGADATIAVLPVPLAAAHGFGVVDVGPGGRVRGFLEKPERPAECRAHPGCALASMGNYVFSTEVLVEALARADVEGHTDFGQHVLPALLRGHRVMSYDFQASPCPGSQPEGDADGLRYWRDIGTLDAYFAAHMDTLGAHPVFALDDASWPIGGGAPGTPRVVDAQAEIGDSSLGNGVIVEGAMLDRVVAGAHVRIERQAQVDRAVLMAGSSVGAGARLHRVIVDEGNAIPAGEVIGFDPLRDRARFPVSAGGIVVVPRHHFAKASRRAWMPVAPLLPAAVRAQA